MASSGVSTSRSPSIPSGNNPIYFKVVLLGEGCVGKTSMVLRYVEDKFNDSHETTVQASFVQKKINIDGKRVSLAIWDTAGQEKFHALGPIYYRHSNGAILVYDLTDKESFQKVKLWVRELKKMLGNDVCLTIAGNKFDLVEGDDIDVSEAAKYAKLVGAVHFLTSAKLNHNIEELFLNLTERMLAVNASKKPKPERRNVVMVEQEALQRQPKSGCC